MSSVIHMDTEQVWAMARQLDNLSADIQQEIASLGSKLRDLNWQSPSRDRFIGDFAVLQKKIQACAEQGAVLGLRVQREVDEWEKTDQELDGSNANYPTPFLVIGGGILIIVGSVGFSWWYTAWSNQNLLNLTPQEVENKIKSILGNSSTGKEALKKAEKLGVKFEVGKSGKATYYNPKTNTMYIDPETQPDLAAESYIHELQHAIQDEEGSLPDASTLSREEYIDRVVDIEAEALIKEFEYENGEWFLDQVHEMPGEDIYQKTYDETMKSLKESNPQMSAEEMQKIAYEAGKEEVKKLYKDGTIITSTNKKSYVDNAGEDWDRVHTPLASGTASI